MFRLPRLPSNQQLTDQTGKPTAPFQQWWQQVVQQIEQAIKLIVDLTGIQEQFELALMQAQQQTAAAKAAADAANAAALAAQQQAAAQKREAALQGSYIRPDSVLTATPTTITIAPHTRVYADADMTQVSVNGGSIAATATGDFDYIFYDDPDRMGGAVTYQVSTTQPVQTGDRHVVEGVLIPDTGTSDGGGGPRPPGYVGPRQQAVTP